MQRPYGGSMFYLRLEISRVDVVEGQRDRGVKCASKREVW